MFLKFFEYIYRCIEKGYWAVGEQILYLTENAILQSALEKEQWKLLIIAFHRISVSFSWF